FSQSLFEYLVLEYCLFKNRVIRHESDFCSCLFRAALSDYPKRVHDLSSRITLLMDLSVSPYFHYQPVGKGIDDGRTYTVETAGHFVSASSEFSAGMKYRKYDFHGRKPGFMVDAGWNASS